MVYNQLFKIIPDKSITIELLNLFGIKDLDDNKHFTKDDLIQLNTSENILKIKDKLNNYYIPCKSKVYLNNIDHKRSITILKQFLKVHNYNIINIRKVIQGRQYNLYFIKIISEKVNVPKKKIMIDFN